MLSRGMQKEHSYTILGIVSIDAVPKAQFHVLYIALLTHLPKYSIPNDIIAKYKISLVRHLICLDSLL